MLDYVSAAELPPLDNVSSEKLIIFILAKKNVEAAKLSYDFGTYDRALMYTKQAFFYSTLSFVLGISIYFSAIVGGCLYVFLE